MIHFFRNLRSKSVGRGSIREYVLYGFGEIFLVMFGILLALQVNRWNENRKASILENEFLQRLQSDLTSDITYFLQRKDSTKKQINHYRKFLTDAHRVQNSFPEFQELMCCLDYPPTELHINTTTYTELVSTGEINTIKRSGTRESVIRHYESYQRINKHLVEYDGFSNLILANTDRDIRIASMLKIYLPNPEDHVGDAWKFINDPTSDQFRALESVVFTFLMKLNTSLDYLDEIEASTKTLLDEIIEAI